MNCCWRRTLLLVYTLPVFWIISQTYADELRWRGTLGNSDASQPLFADRLAAGIGPILDDAGTLWERGGITRLNRYALDGRLLAQFPIPEGAERGQDQMVRVGDLLLLKLKNSLYTLPLQAAPGTQPKLLPGAVELLAAGAAQNRALLYTHKLLTWLDPVTGARTPWFAPGVRLTALFVDQAGTAYGFGDGNVFAWDGQTIKPGFPRPFYGERPQKIGRYWYSHAWHGTINRFNASFAPDPGVVLGGASGSFIGYLPESADLVNGRGLVHVRDHLYAVSGLGGVVQLLHWDTSANRFQVVRRLGAFTGLKGLALDAAGNIWTSRGSWPWQAASHTPLTLGDTEPTSCAQPMVLNGKTLCLLKKHYSYWQLARGPIIDAAGQSHLETPGLNSWVPPDTVTGAAVTDHGMLVTTSTGDAALIPINQAGQQAGQPVAVTLPGLQNCTSLAWFKGQLLAADRDAIVVYDRHWQLVNRLPMHGGPLFLHSDGKRLAVSAAAEGQIHVYDSLQTPPISIAGLDKPAQIAIADERLVVYEAGQQRLVKFELSATPLVAPRMANAVVPIPATPAEFVDLSQPGGIPLALAITANAVLVQTPATKVQLGVANDSVALWTSGTAIALPAGAAHGDGSKLKIAITLELGGQQERFGFRDAQPIHAPFNEDASTWADYDLPLHQELLVTQQQQIRISFDQPIEGKASVVIEKENGARIRHLLAGQPFTAGQQTVVWDGLDDQGRFVAPGTYHWRGLTHAGIQPRYVMHFANGDEPTIVPWGPNHSTLQQATANGQYVFFAAPVTEGGWGLVALDTNGKWVQGYELLHGYGIQKNAIAADEQYLYCAQDGFAWGGQPNRNQPDWKSTWKLTLVRYDIQSGKLVAWPGNRRAIEVDTQEVGPHSDLAAFNLGGLASHAGKLYVGSRDKNSIFTLDAATGQQLATIELAGVRHLAAGTELYAATDAGLVRVRDQQRLVAHTDISGLTVATNGDLFISDAKTHQIRRLAPDGKTLGVVGLPGGPYAGPYEPRRLVEPAGLAMGPDGKLWVTENRWHPKRIHAWDLANAAVVVEKFGMPHYGGAGSGFDPEKARRWIGLGCFWDIDFERQTARPTHVLSRAEGHLGSYEPDSYTFFREAGRTFVATRGKLALIAEVLPNGTWRDVAATASTHHFAYAFNWHPPQAYIDAFYAKWPEKRQAIQPGQRNDRQPWAQRGMGVLWVDRNGDGAAQAEEFDFCGPELDYAGSAWGHLQHSLTFYIPVADKNQVKIVAIQPKNSLAHGVPDYPTLDEALAQAVPIDLTPGYKRSGVATVRDRFGRFLFNSDPEMNAYAADGQHLWSYPNRCSDVHGSHDAPLPQLGQLQGVLAFLGIAPLDDTADVCFLNGNHGRCYLISSDGIYLDEVFVDVRVSYLNDEYRLGGEIFGGTFGQAAQSGRYFVQIGHGPYRIYELLGFENIRRLSGKVIVSKAQLLAAERQQVLNLQKAGHHQPRVASIPGMLRWDKTGLFPAQLDLRSDATHLHMVWRVQDHSPWQNNGRDWTKLFATGDTVDFQFGTDGQADPQRRGPVPGDKRLLIAPYEGKPIAVLYEYSKPAGQNPIEFTSPWRSVTVDEVRQLAAAQIAVAVETNHYRVTASIPLSDLGLTWAVGTKLQADAGVTFGNAAGTDTNLRSYWANQSTGLVDDIPGEILLSPSLWGELERRE